jgi:hypothetical protein
MPRRAIHEPRLMIAPSPRATIAGAMAAVRKKGVLTLTARGGRRYAILKTVPVQ